MVKRQLRSPNDDDSGEEPHHHDLQEVYTSDDSRHRIYKKQRNLQEIYESGDSRRLAGKKQHNLHEVYESDKSHRRVEKQRNLKEIYESGGSRRRTVEDKKEEDNPPNPRPVGEVILTTGKGKTRTRYFSSFNYDGTVYELGDAVMIRSEIKGERPYVAILKYITQEADGFMKVTGQWFYRPEEAKQRCGDTWLAVDKRELFYSFHLDEVPAESVMHKCFVHFVPQNKKLPVNKQYPGFVVQRVYDFIEKRLWKLIDKDYKNNMQHEIDILVQKTIERIGELPEIELDNCVADHAEQTIVQTTIQKNGQPSDFSRTNDGCTRLNHLMKAKTSGICTNSSPQTTSKKSFQKNTQLLDFSRINGATRTDHLRKAKTSGICIKVASKYQRLLSYYKALTGDEHRDKWLEKLLEHFDPACSSSQVYLYMKSEDDVRVLWPEAPVEAITALEKASHDALGYNLKAYNAKIRQLIYNLKESCLLTKCLLNKELDPTAVVNMDPNELKETSLLTKLLLNKELDPVAVVNMDPNKLKMINAICSICSKLAIGIKKVIHTAHEDRYEVLCKECGNESSASQDYVLSLPNYTPQKVAGNAPN